MADISDHAGMAAKPALRRAALARRDALALDIDHALEAAEAVAERALALPELDAPGIVAGYWPIRSELDPRPLMERLADRGVALALPIVTETGLIFRRWTPWEVLVPGGFGTLGPSSEAEEVAPDVLLVPLAAFDRRCHRLGYGKGHYDGAIARLSATGTLSTIGLAYAAQEVADIPEEGHDQRLDAVVTEDAVVRPAV